MPKEFALFLSYTHNLLVFDINWSGQCNKYSTFLSKLDPQVYLKHIQHIQYCDTAEVAAHQREDASYFLACCNFRATLIHLVAAFARGGEYTIGSQKGDCLSFLPEFRCLTHLDFHNDSPSNNLTAINILSICPN